MFGRRKLGGILALAVLAAACGESVGPYHRSPETPLLADVVPGSRIIALDQSNGSLAENGTLLIKGFNPTNPHRGDAIIATFYWVGSTNIIDHVADVITTSPYTPVGNQYTLVEYVTAGGYSMATYVATNVQSFPDPNTDPGQGDILAVGAWLSEPVTDGGVTITAWSGVNSVAAYALGAHRSAAGSGSAISAAGPGSISIGAGAFAYAVTMSNGLVGRDPPPGFSPFQVASDAFIVAEGDFAVQSAIGSVNPQWTWYWPDSPPSTWLATVLALNPPLHLAFSVQPSTTLPLMTIAPAVRVTVLDALDQPVTTFTGQVTIAIGRNGGMLVPGTLSGTKTVNVVNGAATFSDLSIDQPGNGYTLFADVPGVFSVTSASFNIGAM